MTMERGKGREQRRRQRKVRLSLLSGIVRMKDGKSVELLLLFVNINSWIEFDEFITLKNSCNIHQFPVIAICEVRDFSFSCTP